MAVRHWEALGYVWGHVNGTEICIARVHTSSLDKVESLAGVCSRPTSMHEHPNGLPCVGIVTVWCDKQGTHNTVGTTTTTTTTTAVVPAAFHPRWELTLSSPSAARTRMIPMPHPEALIGATYRKTTPYQSFTASYQPSLAHIHVPNGGQETVEPGGRVFASGNDGGLRRFRADRLAACAVQAKRQLM
ncbi:MAG: hypothetical protein FE78DRAFT_199360 [Acidomyces sp. 'richmondensis']|nr:MAG: hypothetical protein FE78DRAFT_199360 [Acidomyces sp. 'richmondensis']